MSKTLKLGRVHWAHATRATYCGTGTWLPRTTTHETRVTCLACQRAYDVEMSNRAHKAAAYAVVSDLQ